MLITNTADYLTHSRESELYVADKVELATAIEKELLSMRYGSKARVFGRSVVAYYRNNECIIADCMACAIAYIIAKYYVVV